MPYDVKKLGNRLPGIVDPKTGLILSYANQETHMEPNPQPPTALQQITNVAKIVLAVLATVATAVISLPAAGVPIPAPVLAICASILGLAAAFGIVSKGVVKPAPAPTIEGVPAAKLTDTKTLDVPKA